MKKIIFVLTVLALLIANQLYAGTIKLAVVAPEGSTWVKVLEDFNQELKNNTAGRWSLTIYPGGVAGDEKVVLKKMRIGQLDGAGLTGVGLGEIFPAVRVLELPFLFQKSTQVDYVVEKLLPDLKQGFRAKGFEFLGWAEAGFVYIFANKKITGIDDMQGVKMWMWQGDPLAKKMYDALGIVPVPLALTDVNMALQTNMINGVYAPPLAAVAMQWFAKTKYMSDAKLVNSIGALLVTRRAFNKMSVADQNILKNLAEKYCKKLVDLTRQDNIKSIQALREAGIEIIKVPGKNYKELQAKSKSVWQDLVGDLYSQEMLDKTLKYVKEGSS